MTERSSIEQIKIAGEHLLEEVERIIEEGNVRRIVIKQEGRIVAEFPLTIGVIGAALNPVLAAIGALAAALTHCTLEVERVESVRETLTPNETANLEFARMELDEALIGEPLARR